MPEKKQLFSFDSYVSMAIGLAVVLVFGALIYNTVSKNVRKLGDEQKKSEATISAEQATVPSTYTVSEGDSLWKISEKYYKTGYNWSDIAKVNNLTSPDSIEKGQTLSIPVVTPIVPAGSVSSATTEPRSYTVKPGDFLWKIAVEQYGNGFKWLEIANANKLQDPNVIHVGNVLILP